MFHLAAYFGNVGLTANAQLSGLVDPVLSRSATSSAYIFQSRLQLVAAVAMSTTLARANLVSPTLRQINPPFIRPVKKAAIPGSNDQVCWWGDQPLILPALEEVAPVTNNTSAANENTTVGIWIAQAMDPVPPGQIFTARATATFTATANAWTAGSFTFDQSLPSGTYALVGSECISANGQLHRWAFPNQLFRPGSLSHQSTADINDFRLQTRRLGNFGNFLNTAPPLLEVLCNGADASHEIYMQLIPLGLTIPTPI